MTDEPKRHRRPTLEDVARAAGVSRALVSIVVREAPGASDETRRRVLRVAAELGYRPDARARLLARSRTQLIGVVFNIQHAFHADVLVGIYSAADEVGYEVVLSGTTPGHDERRAVEALLGYRCDALILLGPDAPDQQIADLAARLPVVVVGRRIAHGEVDAIRTDDMVGMRLAVNHLVRLGHRDIAHVDGGAGAKASDRRRGYRAAMAASGLRDRIRVIPGGQTSEAGVAAAAPLAALASRPSAVVAYDDDCASGLVDGLRIAGVDVPADVSVVGYDGSRLSRSSQNGLTTVAQDALALASIAVDRAVARLAGYAGSDRAVVLEPSLVVRRSTARLDTARVLR
jgi:DNA-binding LacI/PurR family transcriptional regulator